MLNDFSLSQKVTFSLASLLLLMVLAWTFPSSIIFIFVNVVGLFLFGYLTISILKDEGPIQEEEI